MEEVNEQSTSYLTISPFDRNDAPAVPTGLYYRIDCVTTGTAITAETSLTPASSVVLTITPQENRIITNDNDYELRKVTIRAEYSGSDQHNEVFDYKVKNLSKVSP